MVEKEDVKEKPKKTRKSSMTKAEMEQALIDNFISLQKVLTNLTVKFDTLAGNIEKLLQLFEISAKSFTGKYEGEVSVKDSKEQRDVDKAFISKLDSLLDQNKAISKGILMMEERVRNRMNPSEAREEHESRFPVKPKPLPRY